MLDTYIATGDAAALVSLAQDQYASGVYALNVWMGGVWNGEMLKPVDVQSQLIQIPAPAGVLLVTLGLGLVGWVKKRLA